MPCSTNESHPLRVRGLKQFGEERRVTEGAVAPFTGAWIETSFLPFFVVIPRSHPLRVRGLKLILDSPCYLFLKGRTLYGCVD